jgi:hypothetical protein
MKRSKINKLFITLITLVIILSLIVTVIHNFIFLKTFFTGYATYTSNATINLTVLSTVAINFTTNNINFGTGFVNPGFNNATLDSSGGAVINGQGFTPNTAGLVLENIGNSNVSLQIKTGKNAAGFFGIATNAAYQYNVTNVEANSCINATDFDLGTYYDVNTSSDGTLVCSVFPFENSGDSIRIDIKLVVPYNSINGSLSDQIIVTASG